MSYDSNGDVRQAIEGRRRIADEDNDNEDKDNNKDNKRESTEKDKGREGEGEETPMKCRHNKNEEDECTKKHKLTKKSDVEARSTTKDTLKKGMRERGCHTRVWKDNTCRGEGFLSVVCF